MKVRKIVEKQRIIKYERKNQAMFKYCKLCIYCKVNVITYLYILYLKYSETSATNIAQIFVQRISPECLVHDQQEYVITCEWTVAVKWKLTGYWPVQSKWNYPKLKFIPFDMEHQFGYTEIGGIWRKKIVYIILNANQNTFKGQLRAKFCLPQCCQWRPRLLPTKAYYYPWSWFETWSDIG
jgi:hypothetical protein